MPKKKHMIVARNTKTSEHGLMTSKGKIPFNMKTAKIIDDDSLANEIDSEYGLKGTGDVWVARDERLENQVNYHPDDTHKFFFGSSKKYAQEWERIFKK